LVVAAALQIGVNAQSSGSTLSLNIALFERYLESLRVQSGIPGLSAAIVQDGQVVWERGLGQADVESNQPARPDTPYHVADLSQTFAAALLAQCAERGAVQPDDSIRRWVPLSQDPPASLRQVLSHTSGAGGAFVYNPARFAELTTVVDVCASQSYPAALARAVIDRLAMTDAAPGRVFDATSEDGQPLFDAAAKAKYAAVVQRVATAYRVDRRGRSRAEGGATTANAATGLIASVRDLSKFDAALDENILFRGDTLAQVWTNQVAAGVAVPMGLGWFSQNYEGQRLIWHFGLVPEGHSALLLKIPARRLTLILLANSDGLSAPYALPQGDVTSSLFAQTFLRLFL
jgi:CubicO group peptidase (beta-lactamase class C family)